MIDLQIDPIISVDVKALDCVDEGDTELTPHDMNIAQSTPAHSLFRYCFRI